jgi:hypothetical protein
MSDTDSLAAPEIAAHIFAHSRMCFATRATEFKTQSVADLGAIRSDLTNRKKTFISSANEDQANLAYSLEQLALSIQSELQMWLALTEGDGDGAWASLISAQVAIRSAIQAHPFASKYDQLPNRLLALEKLLFPPQIFFSPGIVIRKSLCSICHLDYDDCEHIVGRPYMGEICAREITEFELQEVSVVPSPANKLARAHTITEDGVTRNLMSWRETDRIQPAAH